MERRKFLARLVGKIVPAAPPPRREAKKRARSILDQLDLVPAQTAQLQAIFDRDLERYGHAREELERLVAQQKLNLVALNEAEIRATSEQIREQRQTLNDIGFERTLDICRMLEPRQRLRFAELQLARLIQPGLMI